MKKTFQQLLGQYPQQDSGFCLTDSNKQALDWRLMLIDRAEHTIDLQYFIWHSDFAGRLILNHLLQAADRGVRIRLLVDDFPLDEEEDRGVAFIDHHINIDIKLFNPTVNRIRWRRLVELITHAGRLNHRMHNKLLIVDSKVAIFGGRNIGNEYFGLNKKMNFVDLECIAYGYAAELAEESFRIYWKSPWAVTAKKLLQYKQENWEATRQTMVKNLEKENPQFGNFALSTTSWDNELSSAAACMSFGTAIAVQDDPSELNVSHMSLAGKAIDRVAGTAEKELFISSPYFIPGKPMLYNFQKLLDRGVEITVLTNSLMTNNHISAHSGYIKFRKKVIAMGIKLYELHHEAQLHKEFDTPPIQSDVLALHAKAVIIDRKKMFIGSLNFDPREIYLNSENGFIIDNQPLAERASELFHRIIDPQNSWRVILEGNSLKWQSSIGTFYKEPDRDFRQRMQLLALYSLPIEKQL